MKEILDIDDLIERLKFAKKDGAKTVAIKFATHKEGSTPEPKYGVVSTNLCDTEFRIIADRSKQV